ncbi:MAG: ACT domain-containing protein [Eubacteriales bacterium]
MDIILLPQMFSVCKLPDLSGVDLNRPFCFLGVTDEEVSLVCPDDAVPADTLAREDGWRGFRVQGVLDFSLVGILAQISSLLARHGISIFAVSTYNTDYIFTKADVFDRAIAALVEAGYRAT